MRNLLALLLVLGLAVFSGNVVYAQGDAQTTEQTTATTEVADEGASGYQVLKKYFAK